MPKYTKYITTVGLNTEFSELGKTFMAKVWFGKLDNNTWDCWVESARNGSIINALGKKNISQEQFNELPDHQDNIDFARQAFAMFGGSI